MNACLLMRCTFHTILTVTLLSAVLACHTDVPSAKAAPSPAPLFKEDPKKMGAVQLAFSDTSRAEWKPIKDKLDSFYYAQARAGFNGSVLIGYHGKILYEKAMGWADKEHGVALTAQAPSQLASVSKTFTGAAVLYLYERKYLNIDDSVSHYLKEFPYPGITLRMLLCHRSGLPDYTHWVLNFLKDGKTPISNAKMLEMMHQFRPRLDFTPNTRFKYSNTNYATLALVIEQVTGQRYKDFMKKYFFDALGMQHTYIYDPADGMPPGAAVSYKGAYQREPIMFADGIYGDKGIYSTVEDMYRWDQSFYQNKLLSNATLELAYGPCSFEKGGVKNYGLGWRMLCYPDGYKIIYHNGWWHGNNTCFYRFIKDNFTIIVLGNRFSNAIYHQPLALYKIVNGNSATPEEEKEEGEE